MCDLDAIKRLKKTVSIPVIGNGDIKNEKDALKMFEYTNVDGIMIARGTLRKTIYIRRYYRIFKKRKNSKEKRR